MILLALVPLNPAEIWLHVKIDFSAFYFFFWPGWKFQPFPIASNREGKNTKLVIFLLSAQMTKYKFEKEWKSNILLKKNQSVLKGLAAIF